MNLKELVDAVAADTQLPAKEVRKVSLSILQKFSEIIESQVNFVSPIITLTSITTPAKPASEGKPAVPERKVARMAIRPQKAAATPPAG